MTAPAAESFRLRCIEAVVGEGERFGILAAELTAGLTPAPGGLAAGVPWVPAWTARDLVHHLGNVHRWATVLVTAGPPAGARTEPLRSAEARVSVTTTDTGRDWEVRVTRGLVEISPERSGRVDAHLEGAATQVLLRLCGRPADVRVHGSTAAEALLRGR